MELKVGLISHVRHQVHLNIDFSKKKISWLVCSKCGTVVNLDEIGSHVVNCNDHQAYVTGTGEDNAIVNFFQAFDSIFHLILCAMVAWFLGYLGLSFYWAICLFIIIYKTDKHVKKKEWRREYVNSDQTRRQVSQPELLILEKLEWFNNLVDKFWPAISPGIDNAVKNFLIKIMNDESIKPSSVNQFSINSLVFGNAAPHFCHAQFDVDVLYAPADTVDITIVAEVSLVKVPIKIQHIYFKGRMNLTLQFIQGHPLIDAVEIVFLEPPQLDIGIQVAKMDITDVSFLHQWLTDLITDSIPQKLQFSIKDLVVPTNTAPKAAPQKSSPDSSIHPAVELERLFKRYFHPHASDSHVRKVIHQLVMEQSMVDHGEDLEREDNKIRPSNFDIKKKFYEKQQSQKQLQTQLPQEQQTQTEQIPEQQTHQQDVQPEHQSVKQSTEENNQPKEEFS